jgi:hypothetical protein
MRVFRAYHAAFASVRTTGSDTDAHLAGDCFVFEDLDNVPARGAHSIL